MRFGKESRGQVKARQNAPGAVAFEQAGRTFSSLCPCRPR